MFKWFKCLRARKFRMSHALTHNKDNLVTSYWCRVVKPHQLLQMIFLLRSLSWISICLVSYMISRINEFYVVRLRSIWWTRATSETITYHYAACAEYVIRHVKEFITVEWIFWESTWLDHYLDGSEKIIITAGIMLSGFENWGFMTGCNKSL